MTASNAKLNPFYIDRDEEENPWDDDNNDDDYYDDEDDDDDGREDGYYYGKINNNEQMKLMSRRNRPPYSSRSRGCDDYHEGRYRIDNNNTSFFRYRPQIAYVILALPIAFIFFIFSGNNNGTGGSTSGKNGKDYVSLIDEIPNDEYKIVVLGERHSGTTWIKDRIQECFPQVHVTTALQRPTYFFQDDEETANAKDRKIHGEENQNKNTKEKTNNIIAVHVTLNVYDWLQLMRLSPQYAPNHVGTHKELGHAVPLEWREFVTKLWTMERPTNDLQYANMTGPICQHSFSYNEVVSCNGKQSLISSHGDPIYELQRNSNNHNDTIEGLPYNSIIGLRADKLRNHQNISHTWPSVKKMIHIPYEAAGRKFKKGLIYEILNFTGWNGGKHTNDNTGETLPCSGDVLPPSLDSSKEMTIEYVKYVSQHVDWEAEERSLYKKWTKEDAFVKGIHSQKKKSKTTSTSTPISVMEKESTAIAIGQSSSNSSGIIDEATISLEEMKISTLREGNTTSSEATVGDSISDKAKDSGSGLGSLDTIQNKSSDIASGIDNIKELEETSNDEKN